MLQHAISKQAEADIVIIAACGELNALSVDRNALNLLSGIGSDVKRDVFSGKVFIHTAVFYIALTAILDCSAFAHGFNNLGGFKNFDFFGVGSEFSAENHGVVFIGGNRKIHMKRITRAVADTRPKYACKRTFEDFVSLLISGITYSVLTAAYTDGNNALFGINHQIQLHILSQSIGAFFSADVNVKRIAVSYNSHYNINIARACVVFIEVPTGTYGFNHVYLVPSADKHSEARIKQHDVELTRSVNDTYTLNVVVCIVFTVYVGSVNTRLYRHCIFGGNRIGIVKRHVTGSSRELESVLFLYASVVRIVSNVIDFYRSAQHSKRNNIFGKRTAFGNINIFVRGVVT